MKLKELVEVCPFLSFDVRVWGKTIYQGRLSVNDFICGLDVKNVDGATRDEIIVYIEKPTEEQH